MHQNLPPAPTCLLRTLTILKELAACSRSPTSPLSVKYLPLQIPSSSGLTMSSEIALSSRTFDDMCCKWRKYTCFIHLLLKVKVVIYRKNEKSERRCAKLFLWNLNSVIYFQTQISDILASSRSYENTQNFPVTCKLTHPTGRCRLSSSMCRYSATSPPA